MLLPTLLVTSWCRRFALGCLAVLLLLGGTGRVSATTRADDYLKIRARATVVTDASAEDIQVKPDNFTGKLVEIRGLVTAIAGTTVLVQTAEGGVPTMVNLPGEKSLSDWPFLDVGIGIRALCQVIKVGDSGSLEVVIPVKEYEVAAQEQEQAKAKAALDAIKASRRSKPKPESKGALTDQELVEIYGGAIQHFNQNLSDADGQFMASRIIDESRKKGLDARLFVAVVAIEGTFERAVFLTRGAYLGNQTARTAIARIGTDLSRRIDRAMLRNSRQNTSLGRALAARRRELTAGKKPSRAEVEDYVNRVVRLYLEMSGEDVGKSDTFYSEAPDYEAKWRARRWLRPTGALVGTWEAAGGAWIAVLNADGSGVFGPIGEDAGRWSVSGGYLEFRAPGRKPLRFKWKVSDDRKALTVVRIAPDSSPIGTVTLLRR